MPRLLVTQPTMIADPNGAWRKTVESAGFEIVFPPEGVNFRDAAVLPGVLEGIDAVLATTEPYNRAVLRTSHLRAIARVGVGYDSVDVPAATELGIPVTITPGANEISVAEQTIAMILAVSRDYPRRDLIVRRNQWLRRSLPRLAGRTLGIIGLGRIGRAVATRAAAMGMKIVAYDPIPDKKFAAEYKIDLVSADDVLRRADYVTLHCAWTPETTDFINARTLSAMKPGAVLVNTARGGLVDETALVAALKSGQLSAAALDVFKTEPLPADSPLREMDNVLLSPHTAGLDDESCEAMNNMAAQCIVDLYQGRWPQGCVVNGELREFYRW